MEKKVKTEQQKIARPHLKDALRAQNEDYQTVNFDLLEVNQVNQCNSWSTPML